MRLSLIVTFLVFYSYASYALERSLSFDEKPNCERQGGIWRQFGNSCAGNCDAKFDPFIICAQAITYGCDCLQDSCFQDGKCVAIADYQKSHNEAMEAKKSELELKKEERREKFLANQQMILRKFFPSDPNAKKEDSNKDNQQTQQINNTSYQQQASQNPSNSVAPTVKVDENFELPPHFAKTQEQNLQKLQQQQNSDTTNPVNSGDTNVNVKKNDDLKPEDLQLPTIEIKK